MTPEERLDELEEALEEHLEDFEDCRTERAYGEITLTAKGAQLAKQVVRRHDVLSEFFEKVLAIDKATATECACKMEHAMPNELLERLVELLKCEAHCSIGHATWIDGVGFVCREQPDAGELCEPCTPKSGTCERKS